MMKGSDIVASTTRFSDLDLLCPGMVNPERKKVERFILGLTPLTQGNVLATNQLTFDSAKHPTQILIDHGDCQDSVSAAPKPPKEGGAKKKFWNKRKGQSS